MEIVKPAKQLWRISVGTTLEAEDAVSELLGSILGGPAVSCFDVETGVCTVTVYGDREPLFSRKVRDEISDGLKRIEHFGLRAGPGKITVAKVRREDWAESWKRHFKPVEIGKSLLIQPSWSTSKPREDQAMVVLDPGLSFGTGQHPTTAFCLGELVRRSAGRARSPQRAGMYGSASRPYLKQSFLDLGTGSGILAIAAAKLGYKPVCAIDFDPDAVRVARANARANRVHNKLRIARGDVAKLPIRPARQYDLICANLISDMLVTERRRIAAQLARHGTLVLAGILKSEFGRVQTAFEKLGLKLVSSKCQMEWRSGSFRSIEK